MVAAAPTGGLGRCVAHSGGAWRASVRRRLCRPAIADLSSRARLQRARGRHHCHRHAGRHRPDDSVGWLGRQPVFPAPAAFDRGRADGRDRGGFAAVAEFWPLLVIAVVGTMNPTSGDASIFVPLEQTVLTETIEPRRRTALFARYSVIGSCATALGVLAAGFSDYATAWARCSRSTATQLMFGLYAFLGLGAFLLYRPLSPAVEVADKTPEAPLGPSKKLVYGMAVLFGMDSFGTGFLVQSLLALWLYQAFQVSVTTTATILFWSGVCSAISYLVAVPIAERIGLIKTMVFTHLPSNVLLILIPFAPNLATAIALLLARSALSQMDVPTRTSYVMAVVTPPERPAAASITAVPKTFAWAAGSMISGYLLTLSTFGWPLLIAGTVKGTYDILLLIKFQKVRPPEKAAILSTQ